MRSTFPIWERVFQIKQFDLSKDLHFISASDIKQITGAEPRIMAKMDNSLDLSDVFRRNGYFLLPVKNGEYAIVRGNGFHVLEARQDKIESFISRISFPLITAGRGLSEMQYIDYSFNSGALEKIVGIAPLYQSIRGREYSRAFSFYVNSIQLHTNSVQIEVDSGLEGEDSIVLIEAKMGVPEDFIIRQLYYPYSHYRAVAPHKKIIPVFFSFEKRQNRYSVWIYEFTNPIDYNSICLKEVRTFQIHTEHEIKLEDIHPRDTVKYKDLIPQANDIDKIIELIFKVSEGIDDYKRIADYFQFEERQSAYYREAAEALGLLDSHIGKYVLTDTGRLLVHMQAEKRNIYMVELLSDFNLVKYSLEILRERGELHRADLELLIEQNSALTGSTIIRRASSLLSWLKWMAKSTGFARYESGVLKTNYKNVGGVINTWN